MEQIEKFIWNTAKNKLEIKLPLKVVDDPLLLCIEFNSDGERYCFGEAKAVRQIAEDSNCLSKHGGSILTLSEQRPFGSLLMDSYDFVRNGLPSVESLFRSMLNSIDSGNSEKSSDYKMLEKLWREGTLSKKSRSIISSASSTSSSVWRQNQNRGIILSNDGYRCIRN